MDLGSTLSAASVISEEGLDLAGHVPFGPAQRPDDNWIDLGFDWFLEHGPEERVFGPETFMTQDLMDHPGVNAARAEFYENGFVQDEPYHHDFGPGGYIRAWRELDGTGHFLGSYDVIITNNGDGTATFEVRNVTGWRSGTNLRSQRTDDSLEDMLRGEAPFVLPPRSILNDRERAEWGPGGNFTQIFRWEEPITGVGGGSVSFH